MTKYQIGDRFVAEITDVDEQGMGVAYTLNDNFVCNEYTLDMFELQEIVPLSKELEIKSEEKKTYTPEDLKNRIFMLSKLLAQTIEKYEEITTVLNAGIPNLDQTLKDLSL